MDNARDSILTSEIERLQLAVHRLVNNITALTLRLDLLEMQRERQAKQQNENRELT
jgi:hypothetical protein